MKKIVNPKEYTYIYHSEIGGNPKSEEKTIKTADISDNIKGVEVKIKVEEFGIYPDDIAVILVKKYPWLIAEDYKKPKEEEPKEEEPKEEEPKEEKTKKDKKLGKTPKKKNEKKK